VVTVHALQAIRIDLSELLAIAFLRLGSDTRVPRAFREQAVSGLLPERPAPGQALSLALETLGIPEQGRARARSAAERRAAAALAATARQGLRTLPITDPSYPPLLREIPDPPIVLWVRGDPAHLLSMTLVAVVGSRNATPDGLLNARRLARGLSEAGLGVVSGLARGIDGAAHRGALEGPGSTVAVLGCGLDTAYPPEHRDLATEVSRRGLLLSEYPPGVPPLPRHFPLRNRIISGLARAVVVVEASDRSGSLITARAALEQGRDVLAVPGVVASGCHRGCHALIKDGARLVETADDILEEIGRPRLGEARRVQSGKSSDGSWLLPLIPVGAAVDLEGVLAGSGRSAAEVLAEFGRLEIAGQVARLAGGRFARLD
jgi:DNA processing protein